MLLLLIERSYIIHVYINISDVTYGCSSESHVISYDDERVTTRRKEIIETTLLKVCQTL